MSLQRRALPILWVFALLAVILSAASANASPPPSPFLNPLLYPGTFRPSSSCANPKSCTSFDITFTNQTKVTVNSFMIEVLGNPFTHFGLRGEPTCTATGNAFGPSFADDWICLGLHVIPGGVITGSGIATNPLTAVTTARFDWSDKGTAQGLLPDYSHDIHFYPFVAAESPAAHAANLIEQAIAKENDAVKVLPYAVDKHTRARAMADLSSSATLLGEARTAFAPVDADLGDALNEDAAARTDAGKGKSDLAIGRIVGALASKRAALAIAQKAAKK